MKTIVIETGKGLKSILLELLQPIKLKEHEGSTQYRTKFEFIGTINNPIEAIKKYGKGVYESLDIIND